MNPLLALAAWGSTVAAAEPTWLLHCEPARAVERFSWWLVPKAAASKPADASGYERMLSTVLRASDDAAEFGLDLDGEFIMLRSESGTLTRYPLLPGAGGRMMDAIGFPAPDANGLVHRDAEREVYVTEDAFVRRRGRIDTIDGHLVEDLPGRDVCVFQGRVGLLGLIGAAVPMNHAFPTIVHLPAETPPPPVLREAQGWPTGGTSSATPAAVVTLTFDPLTLVNAPEVGLRPPGEPPLIPDELPVRLLPGATIALYGRIEDPHWAVRMPISAYEGRRVFQSDVVEWVTELATAAGGTATPAGPGRLRVRVDGLLLEVVITPDHIVFGTHRFAVREAAMGKGGAWPTPDFAESHPVSMLVQQEAVRGWVEPVRLEAGLRAGDGRWEVVGRLDGPAEAARASAVAFAAWDAQALRDELDRMVDAIDW